MTDLNVFIANNVYNLLKSLEVYYPKNDFIENEINVCKKIIDQYNVKNLVVVNPNKKEIGIWNSTVKRYVNHDFQDYKKEDLKEVIKRIKLNKELRDQFILTIRKKKIPYYKYTGFDEFNQNRKLVMSIRDFIRIEINKIVNQELTYEASK